MATFARGLLFGLAAISFEALAETVESKNAQWNAGINISILTDNYEDDIVFLGFQVAREGERIGIGVELSGNFARVDDRGESSYEHIQVIAGAFLRNKLVATPALYILGEFGSGLSMSSQQEVDGDDFSLIEPGVSLYVEPRLVLRSRSEYWSTRPSIGVGYFNYAVSDVDFSELRLHFGVTF